MEIEVVAVDDVVRVALGGTVRKAAGSDDPLMRLSVLEIYRQQVLVSMRDVATLNSHGLGWLLTCHKRFSEMGGRMVLHSVPAMSMNVIKMMKLDQILTVAADETHARRLVTKVAG